MKRNSICLVSVSLLLFVCTWLPSLPAFAGGGLDIAWLAPGHGGPVYSLAYSPDGQMLVSGSADATVKLWRADGTYIRTLTGHVSCIWSVAFSPDGQLVASGSGTGTPDYPARIMIWRVSDGKRVRTIGDIPDPAYSVAFSPDGTTLASGHGDATIRLWTVPGGEPIGTLQGHAESVYSVAYSPDGQLLASGSEDGGVKLWRVSDGVCVQTFAGHSLRVRSVTFSPDGLTVASGSSDRTVKLWDVATGQCIRTFTGQAQYVTSVAFSPDGATLASAAEDGILMLWQVSDGQRILTLDHTIYAYAVAFSRDGATLASGGKGVKLWRVSDGECVCDVTPLTGHVISVAFSPDGDTLVSGGHDSAVSLWRVSDGARTGFLDGQPYGVTSVAFSPDGELVASGGTDNTIKILRVSDGACIHTLTGHARPVSSVAFAPDGELLASASWDGTVKLWRPSDSWACIRTIAAHDSPVTSVAFAPDGQLVASASGGSGPTYRPETKLWRVFDGECVRNLATSEEAGYWSIVAFSPDGATIAAGLTVRSSDPGRSRYRAVIESWRVSDGAYIRTLAAHTDQLWALAFSPDGETLASGSWDETVKLWRAADGALLRTYDEEMGTGLFALAFSPGGEWLAYGRMDAALILARAPSRYPQAPEGWLNAGWNWFSIPLEPAGSNGAGDVLEMDFENILYRWDPVLKIYDLYSQDFTDLERGRGYLALLAGAETLFYAAYAPSGDFEIPLPEAGWTWVGQPFDHETALEDCLVRNNNLGLTRTAWEDFGSPDAWVNWNFVWWHSGRREWRLLGLAGADDYVLRPWYGYLVWANTRDLTLIVPRQ